MKEGQEDKKEKTMNQQNSLMECFSDLPDPRMVKKCRHLLMDIVMIGMCATIANADGWEDIAEFGRGKIGWLKQWLALPNGIPSADTFRRVFEQLDSAAFQTRFHQWVQAVFSVTDGQVIAIDGKTARGTCDAQGQGGLHLVSAWATVHGLTLGQMKVTDKANEIVAIPQLLKVLMLKGCIVTLDAMGCQKSIVTTISQQAADYVVTVKGNQPKLYRHIQTAFAAQDALGFCGFSPDYCQTEEHGHGRSERRECWVLADSRAQTFGWTACHTVVRVKRTTKRGVRKVSEETHYYITSLPPLASLVLGAIRAHWGIENGCHWVLDVVFKEDASRTRTRNADDNLALLRKIALNLIRQHPAKVALKRKRYRASLNEDFLFEVIQSSFNLMP
jgi:predicted transposase YbfD/YdcC